MEVFGVDGVLWAGPAEDALAFMLDVNMPQLAVWHMIDEEKSVQSA